MTRSQNYSIVIFGILVTVCAMRFVPDWKASNNLLFGVMTADAAQNIITLMYALPLGVAAIISQTASQRLLMIMGIMALANGLGFTLLGDLPSRIVLSSVLPVMVPAVWFDAVLFLILGLAMLWLSPLRQRLLGRK